MRILGALLAVTMSSLHAEPFLVAHRGASLDAPENTVPAFELAWEQGADAIEGDFHLTKDGEIICLHDVNTGKAAGRKLVVAKSTLAELKSLDVGVRRAEKWKGTSIPTLSEVLATAPADGKVFVEIKCGPEIISPLLATLEELAFPHERVTIIAFDSEVIKAIKTQAPTLQANWLCSVKEKTQGPDPSRATIFKTLRETGADGLGTNVWPGIDAGFLAELQKMGCQHHVWTVDHAVTAQRFLKLGTATITTNRPGALRHELAK